jgi:hypothetical protein
MCQSQSVNSSDAVFPRQRHFLPQRFGKIKRPSPFKAKDPRDPPPISPLFQYPQAQALTFENSHDR